jgi:hypothetical protein
MLPTSAAAQQRCSANLYAPWTHSFQQTGKIYKSDGDRLPPSCLTSGTSIIPEMTVGIPITSPENVALPPRYSAYLLPEETMIKNVVCAGGSTRQRVIVIVGHRRQPTCRSTLVQIMITNDRILGSLSS